jgi:hypothetical protein
LKKEGALCAIYIVSDAASKNQDHLQLLYQIGQGFASKISRGITFHFMWLDASKENEFFKVFDLKNTELPKLAIMNPGKRKRFLIHDK